MSTPAQTFEGRYPDFETWMQRVNVILRKSYGISADDLADREWESDYEAGELPRNAIRAAIQDEYGEDIG